MSLSFADGLFWLSVACCAFAQFFIIRSVGSVHHAPESAPRMPRQRGALEMFWAVLPAVGLAVLLLFTWRAMHPPVAAAPAVVAAAPSGLTP